MSQVLVGPEPVRSKTAMLQTSAASTITGKGQIQAKVKMLNESIYSLCCPVLKPHITGLPMFPGDVILNLSVVQSPTAPPVKQKNKVSKTKGKYVYFAITISCDSSI